jgi:hypothetical protein
MRGVMLEVPPHLLAERRRLGLDIFAGEAAREVYGSSTIRRDDSP